MALIIEKTKKITANTSAVTIKIESASFIMTNASKTATVYFKECGKDNVACTSENGFALMPGESVPTTLCADKLSLVATESADVYFLIGLED